MEQVVSKELREAKADLERGHARILKVFGELKVKGFASLAQLRHIVGELEKLNLQLEAYHHAGQIVALENQAPKASGDEMSKNLDYHRAELSLAKEMHGVTVFSRTSGTWQPGSIESVDDGERLFLRFTDGNNDCRKLVHPNSDQFRIHPTACVGTRVRAILDARDCLYNRRSQPRVFRSELARSACPSATTHVHECTIKQPYN